MSPTLVALVAAAVGILVGAVLGGLPGYLVGRRRLAAEARERWVDQQMAQLAIRYADFRAGRWEMSLSMAREMGAAYVAMTKALLGDAPNYTETRLEFDVKIAESPELYTLVVQRHGPGVLTPHEARQKAEAEVVRLKDELQEQIGAKVGVAGEWGNALADKTAAEATITRVRAECDALNAETRGLNPYALAGRRDAVARIRAALEGQQQEASR